MEAKASLNLARKTRERVLTILLIEAGFMLLIILAACVAAMIQFLGKRCVGINLGFLFSEKVYQYNVFAYIGGLVLYIAAFLQAYNKIMKKYIKLVAEYSIFSRVIFWVLCVIFAFGMFAAIGILMFLFGVWGWGDYIRPAIMVYITWIGWPLITVIFIGIDLIRSSFSRR